MMLFSIITITRNNLTGLENTAASIQQSRCHDYEWIVIDGASSDGTLKYLQELNNPKCCYITEADDGIYDAMNKGIELAKGDFLLFLNAGDRLAAPEILTKISHLINVSYADLQPDFIYGDAIEGGHYKKARSSRTIMNGMFTHHQSMLYRRESLGSMRYNKKYKIAGDYDVTLRFLADNKRTLYISSPICIFETGGLSQRNVSLGRHEQAIIRHDLGISKIIGCRITARQIIASTLRKFFPSLYWWIRDMAP